MTQIPDQEFDDVDYDDGPIGIGCGHCSQDGWLHGCVDDMCRHSCEPEDCPNARPCKHCNPQAEYPW